MKSQSEAVQDFSSTSQGIWANSPTRPRYWSIRRELWENRSIYIAPLAVAAIYLCGFGISLYGLPQSVRELAASGPAQPSIMLAMPYSHAVWLLTLTAFLVGIFYCLDALYGERRDRSILFWKSLPVSDLTTVLSKASIPLVVLPLLILVLAFILQLMMLLLSGLVLLVSGVGFTALWSRLPFFQMQLVMIYGLTVDVLWLAPLYGWLLLISAWARRAAFLWVVLPPLAISLFEHLVFHTHRFGTMLIDRFIGFGPNSVALTLPNGVAVDPHLIPLTQLTPGKFLSSPGLWIGLAFAAAFFAAAVRLRHYREPI